MPPPEPARDQFAPGSMSGEYVQDLPVGPRSSDIGLCRLEGECGPLIKRTNVEGRQCAYALDEEVVAEKILEKFPRQGALGLDGILPDCLGATLVQAGGQ